MYDHFGDLIRFMNNKSQTSFILTKQDSVESKINKVKFSNHSKIDGHFTHKLDEFP